MNCKQGDLAIIVGNGPNAGKLVTCVQFYPVKTLLRVKGPVDVSNVWFIEPSLPAWNNTLSNYIQDSVLRPIRDPGDDAKDEMLRPLPRSQTDKSTQ